jgi:hypothetical protein
MADKGSEGQHALHELNQNKQGCKGSHTYMFIDEFDRNRDARDLIHICLLMNLTETGMRGISYIYVY